MKEDVLKTYDIVSKKYGYNSNSLHKLGLEARKLEEAATKQILEVLNLENYEIIYTSGNAESFTMLANNIKNDIFTNNPEMLNICKEKNIPIVEKKDITPTTFVSVINEDCCKEQINHIDIKLDKKYNDLNKYDFITIEDEIPFFGVLIKRKNIELKNLIHGGKSTTKYRSGTSVTPMIASFSKLVKLKYKK